MSSEREDRPARAGLHAAGLGAAVVLGWVLHDLVVVAGAGRPVVALQLLLPSVAALVVGAAAGWVLRRRPAFAAAVVVCAVWAAVPSLVDRRFPATAVWRPRSLLVLLLAYGAGGALGGRRGARRPGALRLGGVAAFLGCALLAEIRDPIQRPVWVAVAAAVLVLAAGFLGRARMRTAVTAVAFLAVMTCCTPRWIATSRPSRPDLPPPAATAGDGAANLLLVVLDTVRADHLAPYGYERRTTPALDRWVRDEFTRYTNARSTSSWTLPSHASIFTGLFPAQHKAAFSGALIRPLREDAPTLAEVLRESGYRTAGVMANNAYLRAEPGRGRFREAFGIDRGFEHYDDRFACSIGRYLTLPQLFGGDLRLGHMAYRDGGVITDLALDWLDHRPAGPFFLALNYMDAHHPNLPPVPFDRLFAERQPLDPLDANFDMQALLYDRELAHLDSHLDRLLGGLQRRGLLDDTAVIITSDHGEALGDHGLFRHGLAVYESLVHVPLYVRPAGGRTVERVDEDVSGAAVFHLARRLLGFDSEPGSEQSGLVSEVYIPPGGAAEMERHTGQDFQRNLLSWREGTVKYIVSSRDEVDAFDLAVDPHEQHPLALDEPTRRRALERAHAWWRDWPVESERAGEMDADRAQRLRALGYVEGPDSDGR